MADLSAIEWTDATWNPVRGCTKVSPGCKHCYAETFSERFRGVKGHPYEQGFDPRLVPEALDIPLRWLRSRSIFVNSMSDLFGDFVPDSYIAAVFGIMSKTRRHRFQILTKRAKRLPKFFSYLDALAPSASAEWIATVAEAERLGGVPVGSRAAAGAAGQALAVHRAMTEALRGHTSRTARAAGDSLYVDWPLPNVWLGVSVEDRAHGLPRLDHLRQAPAALRFVSFEPLLEDLGDIDLTGIQWAIVGGESGHGARPCVLDWIRNIAAQCDAAQIPLFVKQIGARPLLSLETTGRMKTTPTGKRQLEMVGERLSITSRKGGNPEEWPADLAGRRAFPEYVHDLGTQGRPSIHGRGKGEAH
jgi:protein gp37